MKKVILKNAGMYESDWAIVYLDPNSSFSAGGGRITVITEDRCGSYFFGHVGQPSFEEFIANTRPSYLMGKLFHEIKENIPAEDGQDIIDWIAKNGISELKEARQSNTVSKEQVRELYEELSETGFDSVYNLSNVIDEDCLKTLFAIYGEDCLWSNGFKKKNISYEFMSSMINSVILELKKELCGEAQGEGYE